MKNVKYIFSSVNYPEKKFARKFLIFTHRQLQTLTTLLEKNENNAKFRNIAKPYVGDLDINDYFTHFFIDYLLIYDYLPFPGTSHSVVLYRCGRLATF